MANKIDRYKMENDLFLEMLEVYINSILYLREIYPAAIFRKRRIYSTTAFISIFPPLNDYLVKVLKTAQELKAADKLFQVELLIYQKECELFGTQEEEEILEKYIFRVERFENPEKMKKELDVYILEFEEELRRGLLELNQKVKYLKRLNNEYCRFRIHLETTQNCFVDIVNKDNSKSESFSWVAANENDSGIKQMKTWHMLPVVQVDPFSLLIVTTHR